MQKIFSTSYSEILESLQKINPLQYGKTRNFTYGAVTYLSPYISRGVISTRQVWQSIYQRGFSSQASLKFIQELAWREYFQRVWQHMEDGIFTDIRNNKTGIKNRQIPEAIINAATGIDAVDNGINELYFSGYMHNHLRMYVAGIACNVARSYWDLPSRWMYYHLLDGDIASNTLSWQWVAGSFSSKQYIANQENINKYTGSNQTNTFLDRSYNELPPSEVPEQLMSLKTPILSTSLPAKKLPVLNNDLPTLIYTSYNLDPEWRKNMPANRILLLEPSHFKQHPVSDKVLDFILQLAKNIEGIQVFAGELNQIPGLHLSPAIYSKEHPSYKHIPGIKDERDWMFPEIKGLYNSFFSFWKKCEKEIQKNEKVQQSLMCA